MLEPEQRLLLLDALRPPPGFVLDRAVGTTFSLDLAALLTAPVGFALLDREATDGRPVTDPIALLEAVRRNADRIDIFCQAGMIALPPQFRPIVSYLESTVHEVVPPDSRAIFHPKVWLIRYQSADPHRGSDPASKRFRFLCLSRNLTFDRAWDTVLRFEGMAGTTSTDANVQLARFVRALPGLTVRGIDSRVTAEIDALADELRTVRFEAPDGFERYVFWPLGIDDDRARQWPFQSRIDRLLIVSPFLTQGCLDRLRRRRSEGDILVSRPESLDRVGGAAIARFAETLTLSGDSDPADATDEGTEQAVDNANASLSGPAPSGGSAVATDESVAERPGAEMRGLHAKLFVADAGWRAHVWTGSANATDAAFGGNVEFLVQLEGRKDRCGVDAVVGRRDGVLSLRSMLESYAPPSADPKQPTDRELLERLLDEARRSLAGLQFSATVRASGEDRFAVRLASLPSDRAVEHVEWSGLTVHCHPLSVPATYGEPVDVGRAGVEVEFDPLSFEALTSFFAFRIGGRLRDERVDVGFLVNAPLVGAPTDRRERILVSLLENRGDLMRFLLFLLGGRSDDVMSVELGPSLLAGSGSTNGAPTSVEWQNLFEPMVRALAGDLHQLDDIARLISDLRRTEAGRRVIPEDWDQVWEPIWSARQGLAADD
jgi:hypothetical protein